MSEGFDIKNRLKSYFPVFFELLGENDLDWKTINKVFTKKTSQYVKKYESIKQNIRVEASLFNIITASIQGNPSAISLLDFIQKLFEELIRRLDRSERKLIANTLFGSLTNMDRKYLNFLGELCVLNNVKRNTSLKLTGVEVPVIHNKPNGPKIDFKFLNATKSTHLMVEIVNIQLNEMESWSDEQVNNLLNQKIQGKLNRTGIRENSNFQLIPVLWGSIEELNRVNTFYKTNGISFRNTSIPVCFMSFTNSDGGKVHMFGTIDSIMGFAS